MPERMNLVRNIIYANDKNDVFIRKRKCGSGHDFVVREVHYSRLITPDLVLKLPGVTYIRFGI